MLLTEVYDTVFASRRNGSKAEARIPSSALAKFVEFLDQLPEFEAEAEAVRIAEEEEEMTELAAQEEEDIHTATDQEAEAARIAPGQEAERIAADVVELAELTNGAGDTGTVVGGGNSNTASISYATIGGGLSNTASAAYSVVSGGATNAASASSTVVLDGDSNSASAAHSAVAGGQSNTASGTHATVAGNQSNAATVVHATVSGGDDQQREGGRAPQSSMTQQAVVGGSIMARALLVGVAGEYVERFAGWDSSGVAASTMKKYTRKLRQLLLPSSSRDRQAVVEYRLR